VKEQLKNKISKDVKSAVKNYITTVNSEKTNNLYSMVWGSIEHELVNVALVHTRGNQSQAARILGIDRITLSRIRKQRR
jgi:Fis family transcriptional regulator